MVVVELRTNGGWTVFRCASVIRALHIRSLEHLCELASQWDDLWRRTGQAVPSAQARPLALWCRHFVNSASFHAVVIQQEDRLVAALPLVPMRIRGLVEAAHLPANEWAAGGDLLLDANASDDIVDHLLSNLMELPWPLVWVEPAALSAPRWQAFIRGLERAELAFETDVRYWSGIVRTSGDWSAYRGQWSRNHRRKMDRYEKQLRQRGDLVVRLEHPTARPDVERLVRRGFEVENRSWKGTAQSSVMSQPRLLEFYVEQACLLAESQQLELAFLELDGRPIAFEYALLSPGTYYSMKVGYDPEFAAYSPGQVLVGTLLERFFAEEGRDGFDCMGPLSEALRRWRPQAYPVSRMVFAPSSTLGRWIVQAYSMFWPRRGTNGDGREEFFCEESAVSAEISSY